MPKKKTKQSNLEFDAVKADEEALSPIPSPVLGPPNAANRAETISPIRGGERVVGGRLGGDDLEFGLGISDGVGVGVGVGVRSSSNDDGMLGSSGGGYYYGRGDHKRTVSDSDFSAMQLVRMKDLLSGAPTTSGGGYGTGMQEPATIDEHTPLVLPEQTNFGFFQRADSDLTDENHDKNNDDDLDDDDNNNGDEATETRTLFGAHSIITGTKESIFEGTETIIEGAKEIIADIEDAAQEAWADYEEKRHYDWREDWKGGGPLKFIRWLATGATVSKQTDDEIQDNLNSLARMLSLLREYHDRFGMPEKGGPKDQEYVLREVTRDLYLGGAPIWVLEPVMRKVAEGLTGKKGVEFFMLPRRAFIFAPSSGATSMFEIVRGYDMQRLDAMESVAVKLASYASNTSSSTSVPARWPKPQELRRAFRTESVAGIRSTKEDLAEEILTLASESEGLFYFINTHRGKAATRESRDGLGVGATTELGEFWTVEDNIRELFCRLAAVDAANNIDKLDVERKQLYSPFMVTLFRIGSSAGAAAFWFDGSWWDVLISGALAVMVAWIGNSPLLSKQERIIFEAVASFSVGLISGVISIEWPNHTCFGAMAISGVLDLLQGFRVVYSIIEIMSRHSVTGAADFFEGVFFTALIAYFLRFGQYVSIEIMGQPTNDHYLQCTHGVNEWWYLLLVPIAAISWSGLFNPHYMDLPFMGAHGILGYLVSWQFYKASSSSNLNNFLAAMCVTFSAGITSRFTGRQALGFTVAGLYVLLPGAYLVTTVYSERVESFLTSIILRAIIIGIGAWTGTILCSPTLLGINRGLINHNSGMPTLVDGANISSEASTSSLGSGVNFRRKRDRKPATGSLLFF